MVKIIAVGLAIALISFILGAAVGIYKLPPYAAIAQAKAYIQTRIQPPAPTPEPTPAYGDADIAYQQALQRIVDLVKQQNLPTATARIDFVREFVYQNSIHQADSDENRLDYTKVLNGLFEQSQTQANPPLLECASRTAAMISILGGLDIKSRMVHVFSDDFLPMQSHTFLEAFNPDSGNWEVQDPDNDVYYVVNANGQRAAAIQLVLDNLDGIEPRSIFPDQVTSVKNRLYPHYFEALVYHDEDQSSLLGIININRFDQNDEDFDLSRFIHKHYGKIPLLEVQGFKD
jgi:hypothetical protein